MATIRAGADIIADNNNPTGQVSFLKTITFAVGRASSKLRGCADLQGGTRCNRAENYTPLSTLDYQFREPLKRWVSDAPPGSFPPNRYILRWWDPVTGAVSKEYKVEVTSDFSTVQMAILELRASDYTRELAPFQQYSIAAFNITEESQLCVAKRNGAGTGAKVCRSFKSLGFRHVPANSVFGQVYRANIPNFKIPRGVTDLLNQGRGLYDVSIINGTEASGSPHHIGVVTRL